MEKTLKKKNWKGDLLIESVVFRGSLSFMWFMAFFELLWGICGSDCSIIQTNK